MQSRQAEIACAPPILRVNDWQNPLSTRINSMTKTGARKFRDLLAKGGLIVAPGVYDGYSARLVEAACLARKDDAFAIIARTDALAIEGLDGMLRRARAYAEAGADLIFADAIRSEDQIKRLVDAARVPVTVNMGFGIRSRPTTPLMPLKRLAEIGVRRITLPRMLPAAAIMGMTRALEAMRGVIATGEPVDRTALRVGIEDLMRLMDYDEMRELERRLLTTETLDVKYGTGAAPRESVEAGPGAPA